MKKPVVRWTCGRVCRNSGRLGWRNSGHSADRLDCEPGVDDVLRLVAVDRADGVDDRPARADPLRRGAQQLELEPGQRRERQRRSGREARTPSPEQGASTSARSKPVRSAGSARPSAWTT